MIFGGADGGAYLADVHVLDLVTWQWEQVECGPGPCPRGRHVACAWGTEGMLVHGGRGARGELGDLWLLRWRGPAQCWAWEKLFDDNAVISPRFSHAADVIGDALLITGGHAADGILAEAGVFLLRTREWLSLPGLGQPVCEHGLVAADSGVLVWSNSEGTASFSANGRTSFVWFPYLVLFENVRAFYSLVVGDSRKMQTAEFAHGCSLTGSCGHQQWAELGARP